MDRERFDRAIAAIDAANEGDPNTLVVRGETRPKERAHAELVSEWTERLAPDASEELLLAARAHHVQRWAIPRGEYPTGRSGYLRWRKALQAHHAKVLGAILEEQGYGEASRARALEIIRKRNLGRDGEVQVLEDALCLVFVETQFEELASRLDEEKTLDVTRKTLAKMSPEAIAHAAALPLGGAARALLERALQAGEGQ